MIAARSCGLPAIAIPGTSAWQPVVGPAAHGPARHDRHGLRRTRPPRRRRDRQRACEPRPSRPTSSTSGRTATTATTSPIASSSAGARGPVRAAARTIASLLRPVPTRPRQPNAGTCPQHPGGSTMTEIAGRQQRRLHHRRPQSDPASGPRRARLRRLARRRPRERRPPTSARRNALTAGRPGSWEAEHVRGLVNGTVGWGDEFLADYRKPLP